MASPLPCSLLLLVVLFSALLAAPASASARLGGRTKVVDARTNREMQDLGRFTVDEYNKRRQDESSPPLAFSAVTGAEKQVVAGMKYYLQVATVADGVRRNFDAVVVVKPDSSRELVSFDPCNPEDDGHA